MIIKQGVKIAGLHPKMQIALDWAQEVYEESLTPLVVTSAIDGEHMENSLHYVGKAVDIRTYNLPRLQSVFRAHAKIKKGLEDLGFDVILEKTHIHIEYDPK